MIEQHCGQCKHWVKLPSDPMALGQPAQGECREGPPNVTFLPSPKGLVKVSGYSQPPENFPACSRFTLPLVRVERNGTHDA